MKKMLFLTFSALFVLGLNENEIYLDDDRVEEDNSQSIVFDSETGSIFKYKGDISLVKYKSFFFLKTLHFVLEYLTLNDVPISFRKCKKKNSNEWKNDIEDIDIDNFLCFDTKEVLRGLVTYPNEKSLEIASGFLFDQSKKLEKEVLKIMIKDGVFYKDLSHLNTTFLDYIPLNCSEVAKLTHSIISESPQLLELFLGNSFFMKGALVEKHNIKVKNLNSWKFFTIMKFDDLNSSGYVIVADYLNKKRFIIYADGFRSFFDLDRHIENILSDLESLHAEEIESMKVQENADLKYSKKSIIEFGIKSMLSYYGKR